MRKWREKMKWFQNDLFHSRAQVLIIKKGEMQFVGSVDALKEKYESDDLEEIFLRLNGIEVWKEFWIYIKC